MSRLISCLDTAMLKLSKLHMNKHYMSHCMLYLPELYDNHDRLIVSKTRFHKLWANWQGSRFYRFFIYSKLIVYFQNKCVHNWVVMEYMLLSLVVSVCFCWLICVVSLSFCCHLLDFLSCFCILVYSTFFI